MKSNKNVIIIVCAAVVLVLALVLAMFLPKGGETPETPAEKTYYLATATITKDGGRGGSKLANNFAVIVFDADGKIAAARFDSIETAHPSIVEGATERKDDIIVLEAATLVSKVESDYKKGQMSDTWGNQIAKFEEHIKGMTAAQVAELVLADADGKDAGLVAGCTMVSGTYSSMLDCQALVAKAAASTKQVEFKVAADATIKLGLGVDMSAGFDKQLKNIEFTANCAGTVFVGDKVAAAIVDSTVQSYAVASDFTVTKPATYKESKLVLGDDYKMLNSPYGGSTLAEWYTQAQNYADTTVGKTAAEVAGLSTDAIEGKCTIYVGGYKVVLAEAAQNAK